MKNNDLKLLSFISAILLIFSACGSTQIEPEPKSHLIAEQQPSKKQPAFLTNSSDYILTNKTDISALTIEKIFSDLKIKNIRQLSSKQYQITFAQNVEIAPLKKILKEKKIDAEIQPNLVYETTPTRQLQNPDKLQN